MPGRPEPGDGTPGEEARPPDVERLEWGARWLATVTGEAAGDERDEELCTGSGVLPGVGVSGGANGKRKKNK